MSIYFAIYVKVYVRDKNIQVQSYSYVFVKFEVKILERSKHSSRMRTDRAITVTE